MNRYDLNRVFIAGGELVISENGSLITITFKDEFVDISSSAKHHPYAALESLRLNLEEKFQSLLGIYGCRKDVQYRMVENFSGYFCKYSRWTSRKINLFAPTSKIKMLCTVEVHKIAYENWLIRNNSRYIVV